MSKKRLTILALKWNRRELNSRKRELYHWYKQLKKVKNNQEYQKIYWFYKQNHDMYLIEKLEKKLLKQELRRLIYED